MKQEIKAGSVPSQDGRVLRSKYKHSSHKPKLSAMHWNERTPDQKLRYHTALSVLSDLRAGLSYSQACKEHNLDRKTGRRYLGKAIFKCKGRIRARKNDSLLRNMQVSSEGRSLFIELDSSEQATKVAHYNQAVKDYLYDGSQEKLLAFKGEGVTSSSGKFFPFEVDTKKLLEIYERKESFESYEIYEG